MYAEINLSSIESVIAELMQCEQRIRKEYYELGEVIIMLRRIQEDEVSMVYKKLLTQKNDLYRECREIQTMRITLQKIVQKYRNTEEKIAEYEPHGRSVFQVNVPVITIQRITDRIKNLLIAADIRFE